MKKLVGITGFSGMVGSYLKERLSKDLYECIPITRKMVSDERLLWETLKNCDVVINLAGENVASKRWTKKQKKKIYESRVETTKQIVSILNKIGDDKKTLISASGIGYYGARVRDTDEEKSACGKGFLAKVCYDWEKEAKRYIQGRVVLMRFGVIISERGGLLKKLSNTGKYGLLGKIGPGSQKFSWIAIEDVKNIIEIAIQQSSWSGPFNICSPKSVTNDELTALINQKYKKRSFFSIPTFFIKLIFGEMGRELLLADQQVYPKKLVESNYSFIVPDLKMKISH